MNRYIEIKLTKHTLFLTEQELNRLLSHDVDLWQEAIRRGKAILRARQAEQRGPKHISEIIPGVLEEIERRAKGRER
jgi:hypothetical protein